MNVLVVDEDQVVASLVLEALGRLGHDARRAATGHEAIAMAAALPPDLALLDVALPDMSGITLAGLLRGVVDPRALHVVGVSGVGTEKLRRASQRGILDAYLGKPISIAAIHAALRAAAGRLP